MNLTQEIVREQLNYNPETGILTWKVANSNRIKIGQRAGTIGHAGYRVVRIGGILWSEHRVIFLWMEGRWPDEFIDHINGIPDDNRWDNLRECTAKENARNVRVGKASTTGFKNVSWRNDDQVYVVQINVDGTMYHAYRSKSLEECVLFAFMCRNIFHGEFANHSTEKAICRDYVKKEFR